MKKFSLKFQDPAVESEYLNIRMPLTKNFLKHMIAVMLFFVIYSITAAIIDKRTYVPNANAVLLILTLFLHKYHDKFKNIMELLIVIMSIILYGIGLRAIRIFFKDNFNPIVFYIGYNSALFQRLIETRLMRASSSMIMYFGFFLLRITIISEFTAPALIIQVLLEIQLFFSNVERERHTRRLFKSFFDYKQNLLKFKDLITNYFPENIVIFNKDLTSTFFINDFFQKSFACSDINEIKGFMNNLKIDTETIQGFDLTSSHDPEASDSLLSQNLGIILEKFSQSLDENNRKIVNFTVRNKSESLKKEVYQVKVLKLLWDQEEAIAVIFSDLTQQETIMALKMADANKDKVIATVSHELRTPINAIIGFTKILEGMNNDPESSFYLSACKYSANWLLTLVNSILDLSQIRGNCIKLNPCSFNLIQNLDEIKRMFSFQCSQKNLQLIFDIDPEIPNMVHTDKNRLDQILINLLNNALKFTYKGTIMLKVQNDPLDSNCLSFEVTDTGIGIRDEDKEKLFKMYGRVDQIDSNINTQGVGLGLTISNELVRLLNPGKSISGIKFKSQFSSGTTFTFSVLKSLPIEQRRTSPQREGPRRLNTDSASNARPLPQEKDYKFMPSPFSRSSSLFGSRNSSVSSSFAGRNQFETSLVQTQMNNIEFGKHRPQIKSTSIISQNLSMVASEESIEQRQFSWALLVDDMPFNLIVATHILEKKGLRVKTALNGKEAVQTVDEHYKQGKEFKFVLMDIKMPIMDGFEATKILTEKMNQKHLPKIPIIAFSANNSHQDIDQANKSGMVGFLLKPFEEEQFNKQMLNQKISF